MKKMSVAPCPFSKVSVGLQTIDQQEVTHNILLSMRKIYFALLFLGLATAVVAEEGINVASLSDEGPLGWRTELSLMNGLPATNYRRDDDVSAAVTLDYELAF